MMCMELDGCPFPGEARHDLIDASLSRRRNSTGLPLQGPRSYKERLPQASGKAALSETHDQSSAGHPAHSDQQSFPV